MRTRSIILTIVLSLVSIVAGAQSADVLYEKAKTKLDAKQFEAAIPMLKQAANKGHKKAQYWLGHCYDKGEGVEENDELAVQWYTKAAAQNHAKSQYQLGRCYLLGEGVAADETRAVSLLKKAVNNPKGGDKVLDKIRSKAAEGNKVAKRILTLVGK